MDIEKVGKAIAYLRKRAGYTQKDLADRLGVSDKAVSKWERGIGLPDISYFGKLAILLDTDTDSLLSGDVIHHDKGWGGLLVLEDNPYGLGASTVVYDKPMVYYLLGYFLLVGIKEVCIACSPGEQQWLAREFGDGSALGIRLHYCGNTPKEVQTAVDTHLSCSNAMAVFGRSFIYGVDMTRFFQRAMIYRDRMTILSLPKKMNGDKPPIRFDDNRKIVNEEEEKLQTQYDYYEIPVLFCTREVLLEVCCGDPQSGRVLNMSAPAIQDVPLYTEVLDRGYVEISMDTPDALADVAGYVRTVQKACGMTIYCVEEIAWRRGMISLEELIAFGRQKADTDYGKYILSFCGQNE
ncbi:MAG: helix-turn-helix domain-containing protein [Oscillospiraceae bacterium]|nr:helix-turn-helix domain-containing protein [Oscillospiraceae bacterium]